MARFWVGGGGNYTDNTNHWASTSGGSPGASLPGSGDDIVFDSNSSTGNVVINTTSSCLSLTATGCPNGLRIHLSNDLNIFGSLNYPNNGSSFWDATAGSRVRLRGSGTVSSNGAQLKQNVDVNASGTYTLNDDLNCPSQTEITIGAGTLNTNGKTVTTDAIQISSTGSLICGASTLNVRGISGTVLSFSGSGSINGGTSLFNIVPGGGAGGGAGNPMIISLGGATINDIYFTFTSPGYTAGNFMRFDTSFTCNTFSVEPAVILKFLNAVQITCTTLNAIGNSSNHITLSSNTNGQIWDLSAGTAHVDYVDPKDSAAIGSASPFYDPNGTNGGNNSGWNFTSPPSADTSKWRGAILFNLFG